MKPYKGSIWNYEFISFNSADYSDLEPNLGFVVFGYPQNHPSFTNWIRTSAVVKYRKISDTKAEIETLNSRYTLEGPHVPLPKEVQESF